MQALERVSIHGPTLAVLLQSVLTSERCCDGVLFGSVTTTTSVRSDDTQEAVSIEEHEALVSGTLACASTGTFYDGAGAIDGAQLDRVCASAATAAPGQPPEVMGWFSYRPGTWEQPSLREAAATAALQRHLAAPGGGGRLPPIVLLLLTSGANHGGATLHLSYRAFQLPGRSAPPQQQQQQQQHRQWAPEPVELRVINLGKVLSAAHSGGPFRAPALAAALAPPRALPSAAERRLRDAAGGAAGDAAEAVCAALLAELKEAADKAGAGSAALAAARERNARLLQRLAGR